ncbi:hypothetical protein ER639_03685 [Macrococcus sp. DPC7161]|nr:hypothetical protein ER639_03685 [Macrococcus sp. DPC7161]
MIIIEKLKLQDKEVYVLNQPDDYTIFEQSQKQLVGHHNAIFIFVNTMVEFKSQVMKVIDGNHLNIEGILYIAYPKKGNKKYDTFVHRDEIFESLGVNKKGYIRDSMFKFNRMVSLDEVFTVVGLKHMKAKKQSTRKSQSVNDYIEMIPNVEEALKREADLLEFYKELTPGYKNEWARYIYSAKQEKTVVKRIEEMKMIFNAGYKTKDLYRAAKK